MKWRFILVWAIFLVASELFGFSISGLMREACGLTGSIFVAAQSCWWIACSPLIAEFRELTGGISPRQTAAVVQWAKAQGVDLPNLQKGTIAELLGETEDEDDEDREAILEPAQQVGDGALPENVRRALTIRSLVGSSSISKLSRMAQCIARDGRVHRLLQYHGTGPGRWTGRLFNPLNFPRGLVRDRATGKPPDPETLSEAITTGDPDAVDALNLGIETAPEQCDDQGRVIAPAVYRPANPIEAVASALRHAIVAAPRRRLVVGDFVQIQARTVLAIAGQHDFLELLRKGLDPYCLTAEKIYGKPQGTWDKKNCPVEIRQTGKNTFLGCGFQMGWLKFIEKYLQHMEPGPERDAFAQLVITTYRTKIAPEVVKLWRALEEDALRVVCGARTREPYGIRYELEDGWLTARLLDGKKIYYWNPRRTTRPLPWDTSQSKDCWTYQATKQGRLMTIAAYGGLETENVVMGLERQLLVRAMLRCEREKLPVIFNGYDEIVVRTGVGLRQLGTSQTDHGRCARLGQGNQATDRSRGLGRRPLQERLRHEYEGTGCGRQRDGSHYPSARPRRTARADDGSQPSGAHQARPRLRTAGLRRHAGLDQRDEES